MVKDIKSIIDILKTKKAYDILDSSNASHTTFQFGGCWILADALSLYYGLPIYVVFNKNKNSVEHFVVKLNTSFLDSDGIQSAQVVIKKVADDGFYKINDLQILKYDENMDTSGILRDVNASKKLVKLFNETDINLSKKLKKTVKTIVHECLRKQTLKESISKETLQDMQAFGLGKNDIDQNGYVTLYHGGRKLPKILNKDEIFFMTPHYEEAKDYANMRNGQVFFIKVKPDDVNWNQGSYEVEFDKGGKIVNGTIFPNKKQLVLKDPIEMQESFSEYKNINIALFEWIKKNMEHYLKTMRPIIALDKLIENIDELSLGDEDDEEFQDFAKKLGYSDISRLNKDLNLLSFLTIDELFWED